MKNDIHVTGERTFGQVKNEASEQKWKITENSMSMIVHALYPLHVIVWGIKYFAELQTFSIKVFLGSSIESPPSELQLNFNAGDV